MKRFYILLSMAIGIIAVGSLSSCKDTNEIVYRDAIIQQLVSGDNSALRDYLDALKQEVAELRAQLADVKNHIDNCDCAAKFKELSDKIAALEQELNALKTKEADDVADLENKLAGLQTLITNLQTQITNLQTQIDANKSCECGPKWEALETVLSGIKTDITNLQTALEAKLDKTDFEAFKTTFENFKTSITNRVTTLETNVSNLTQQLSAVETTQNRLLELLGQIEGLENLLNTVNTNGGNYNNISELILDIYNRLTQAEATIVTMTETFNTFKADVNNELVTIKNRLAALELFQSTYLDLLKQLNLQKEDITAMIEWWKNMKNLYGDNLETLTNGSGCTCDLSNYATLEELNTQISSLRTELTTAINDAKTELNTAIEGAKTEITNIFNAKIGELNATIGEVKTNLELADQVLSERIDAVEARLDVLEPQITELRNQMDAVQEQLKSQITSIVVQDVSNPVFGTIALPVGLRTQLLTAFYGEVVSKVKFPSSSWTGFVGDAESLELTPTELGTVDSETFYAKQRIGEYEGNAGIVYATINPSTVNLSGTSLKLVDSRNNESGITLSPMEYSDHQVMFGGSRSADNGFYQMKATLDPNKAGLNDLDITASDLKNVASDVKTLIKNRTGLKNLATDAAKAVAKTVNFPAYGLQASYQTFDGQTANVTSTYDIAAIAIHPLSFNTLYGQNYNARLASLWEKLLPASLKFEEKDRVFIKADLNFSINGIGDILSNWSDIEVNITSTMTSDDYGVITVTYTYWVPNPDTATYDPETNQIIWNYNPETHEGMSQMTGTTTINGDDWASTLVDEINRKILDQLKSELERINGVIKDNIDVMISNLETTFDDVTADLNTQIEDAINDINSQINDKLNGVISKYNSFLGRMEDVYMKIVNKIDEPNLLLQPTMLLRGNQKLSLVSQSKGAPEIVAANGTGDMNIVLYATTYTAETLCPIYRKFVKVVNVTGGTAAQNEAAKAKANSALNMDKVLDGNINAIEFLTNSDYKGLTYEIAYAALDYSGYKTTRRFYIKVK